MTPLEKLKARLPRDEQAEDAQLTALLADAQAFILSRTNRREIPAGLEVAQVTLALYWYNRQGMEGESSHSAGGVSRSVEALPEDVQAMIAPYVLLKVVKRDAPA